MFSDFFILRPKFAMVISLFLILAGMICVLRLPIAEYPEVAPPTIVVSAGYTGASAQVIADSVAAPLEAEINGVEGLIYFSSTSSNNGSYNLTLTFKPGIDPDIAMVNVNNAVKRAERLLPTEVTMNGISVNKRTADFLASIVFTTDNPEHTQLFLSNYISNNIKDAVARIEGVGQVMIYGEKKYSMRVWLDPLRMRAYGISQAEVQAAIQSQNIQAATGSIGTEESSPAMQFKVDTKGRLKEAAEFADIIVRTGSDGRLVRLSDIAKIELGSESYTGTSMQNTQAAGVLAVFKLSNANALDVVEKTKKLIDGMVPYFPEGVKWRMGYDSTLFVYASMREIVVTLIITFLLVVLVTYLFLQDWRATLVPMVAIPVSVIGTFLFMYILNMSINTLTMFGLILVIGLVVDDAICVVECCMRLIHEEKLSPRDAAFRAMRELTGALIATTLVVVAIFAPIGFFSGMVGTIYRQFAITMCVSLCLSAVVALTLSPAMCALILRDEGKKWLWARFFNKGLDFTRNRYLNVGGFLTRLPIVTILLIGAILYGNSFFYHRLPTSFLPREDKGALNAEIVLQPGTSLARTQAALLEFVKMIKDIDGVDVVISFPARSRTLGDAENLGMLTIRLKPWDERKTPKTSIESIQKKIIQAGEMLPDAKVNVFIQPAINGLGSTGGISFALQATDNQSLEELSQTAGKLVQKIQKTGKALRTNTSFTVDSPIVYLEIDRDKAKAMNVPIDSIFRTLQSQLGSRYVNDFNLYGKTYKVIIQSSREFRENINAIGQLTVAAENGALVPLDNLATLTWQLGPRQVERFNMFPSATVYTQTLPGVSSGQLMDEIARIVREELPKGYMINWTDMSYQEKQNEGQIVFLIVLAVVFAYLFLVAQYESWTMPLSVMLSVVTATLGGMFALFIARMSLDIYCQLGLLMLVGLTAKTAILMVEYCKQMREEGMSVRDAALAGMRVRFRAVMMTALAFTTGVFPMVVATGAGAGSRVSIGITTFWGMIAATLVGIAIIPGLFVISRFMSETTTRFYKKILHHK
ncbi:MAG: efflux RND transporter permease subunit [Planctomycetaceae bacterium]|nr:efflux RND transporter permease subunit [Planctomycetaceae bacterium]